MIPARTSTLLALLLLTAMAVGAGTVAAQERETRAGATVVVEADETVGDLVVTGASVEVRGTVDGDVRAYAGTVVVTDSGHVVDDVEVVAGRLTVDGDVGGDVWAGAGRLDLGPSGSIGGSLRSAAGQVTVAGEVGRDVTVVSARTTVPATAAIGGELVYDGGIDVADDGVVDGAVRRSRSLSASAGPLAAVPGWAVAGYWFVVNLVAAALLLLAFPRGGQGVVHRIVDAPLRAAIAGVALCVGAPIVLVVLALTGFGVPIALVGAAGLLVALWIGSLFARYTIGAWILERAEWRAESRATALFVGFALTGIAGALPHVGWPIRVAIAILGAGALAAHLFAAYRGVEGHRFGR